MQKFLFPEFQILDLGIQNSTDKESWIQYVVGAKPAFRLVVGVAEYLSISWKLHAWLVQTDLINSMSS